MEERNKAAGQRPGENDPSGGPEPDPLEAFRRAQGKKCTAHHRATTAEVMELIRKHRKGD
jgi:hypothetical protein